MHLTALRAAGDRRAVRRMSVDEATDSDSASGSRGDAVGLGISDTPADFPPLAGFWRRIAAFAVDGLLLGIVGQVLALPFPSIWFEIGPHGRFVGLFIALGYFGLMDSQVGDGQSVGKRFLRIAVRDHGNQPIGIARSALRTLVWLVPVTLNGWALPALRAPVPSWIATVIVFGVGGALVFTMVFNRRSRQGLHDMLCETYVVRVTGEPIEAFPTTARVQWIATSAFAATAMVLATAGMFFGPLSGTTLQQVIRLHGRLEPDPRFFTVGVFDRTFYRTSGATTRTLRIEAWYKGRPSDEDRRRVVNDIANTALESMDSIAEFDDMQIGVTWAYDLGIASTSSTYVDTETIDTWRERVGGAHTSGPYSTPN
jgi:uncharacterized RDD family membrane protein YckC